MGLGANDHTSSPKPDLHTHSHPPWDRMVCVCARADMIVCVSVCEMRVEAEI